jgi:DNA-directed RNA polymerase subunit K
LTEYTKYERARILGARTLQLAMGAPSFVENSEDDRHIDIARKELEEDKLPITVKA